MEPNPFEQQLADVLREAAGPSQPTDVSVMVAAAMSPRRSVLSSLLGMAGQLAAAGALVLVGGFLVLALLDASATRDDQVPGALPSATTTPDWRTASQTEAVAPGIVRVLGDGTDHRLVVDRSGVIADRGFDEVTVGPDGEVWLHAPDGTLFRLGQEGELHTDSRGVTSVGFLDFGVDGSLYTSLGGDHTVVRIPTDPTPATAADFVEVDPGHPAAAWLQGEGSFRPSPTSMLAVPDSLELVADLRESLDSSDLFGRLDDVRSITRDETTRGNVCGLTATADGTPWARICSGAWIDYAFGPGGLARWDGETWVRIELGETLGDTAWVTDVTFLGADGQGGLWAFATAIDRAELDGGPTSAPRVPRSGYSLLRLRDGRWTAWPWATVAWPGAEFGNIGHLRGLVDGPGRLWFGAEHETSAAELEAKSGNGSDVLMSFDGETVVQHESVGSFRDLALHPDGSLLFVGPDGLFVIDPEVAHPDAATPPVASE